MIFLLYFDVRIFLEFRLFIELFCALSAYIAVHLCSIVKYKGSVGYVSLLTFLSFYICEIYHPTFSTLVASPERSIKQELNKC